MLNHSWAERKKYGTVMLTAMGRVGKIYDGLVEHETPILTIEPAPYASFVRVSREEAFDLARQITGKNIKMPKLRDYTPQTISVGGKRRKRGESGDGGRDAAGGPADRASGEA